MAGVRLQTLLGGALLWLLALALCAWIYWPGLSGPAMLDDSANLRPLQLLDEQPDFITDVVAGNLSGPLGRPLTMLSFSLEQVYLGGGVREKKAFNLWLHLLVASLLLVFSWDVFTRLAQPRPMLLAVATASLWLFAPMLLSTVLYGVQRMAQLATCFSLLALWAYLRCRAATGYRQLSWGLVAILALIAAPLSKENGLLAVPLVFWLEWTVLRFDGLRMRQRWVRAHAGLVIVALLLLAAVCVFRPEVFVGGYAGRDFSPVERLLTQPRILWTYVGQLLWVDTSILGLYQDDQVLSQSLLEPWTTLPALLGWCCVVALTVWLALRRTTAGIAFGLGLFLIAHTMESTIFPLEMYFEHRNYLPAAGLFFAAVSVGGWLIARWAWCANWLTCVWLFLLGHAVLATAAEAQLWSNNYLVNITAVNRFPNSLRANVEMSRIMATGGDIQQALGYAARAEELETRKGLRLQLRRINLYCLAGPAIAPEVIDGLTATTADFRDDQVSELIYILVKNIADGDCPETDMAMLGDRLKQLTLVTDPRYVSPKIYVSLAILENHSGRYPQALAYIDALLDRSPDSIRALMMKLYFTSLLEPGPEYQSVLIRLQELDAQGLLNRQQRYNLSLFTSAEANMPR